MNGATNNPNPDKTKIEKHAAKRQGCTVGRRTGVAKRVDLLAHQFKQPGPRDA